MSKRNLIVSCACGKGWNLLDAFKKNGELRKNDTILINLFKHFHVGPYCKVETHETQDTSAGSGDNEPTPEQSGASS